METDRIGLKFIILLQHLFHSGTKINRLGSKIGLQKTGLMRRKMQIHVETLNEEILGLTLTNIMPLTKEITVHYAASMTILLARGAHTWYPTQVCG